MSNEEIEKRFAPVIETGSEDEQLLAQIDTAHLPRHVAVSS